MAIVMESPWDPEGVEICLQPAGELADPKLAAGMDLRALYKRLVAARCLDLRLARVGVPMWVSSAGEEVVPLACSQLLKTGEWLYPGSRDLAAYPLRGYDLDEFLRQLAGHQTVDSSGYNGRPGGISAPDVWIAHAPETLGAHLALAAGQAHAELLRRTGRAVIATLGEGMTTVGLYRETLALAAACDLPLVLVIKSQIWPDGAPAEAGVLGDSVADRVRALGIWARRTDGADVVGVMRAVDQALARARERRGPGVVEVVVTQLSHCKDAPAHRDPVERLRRYLDLQGGWTPTFQDVVEAEARGQLERACEAVGLAGGNHG